MQTHRHQAFSTEKQLERKVHENDNYNMNDDNRDNSDGDNDDYGKNGDDNEDHIVMMMMLRKVITMMR
jgi:hypothetical protein